MRIKTGRDGTFMKFGIYSQYFQRGWDGSFETYEKVIPKIAGLGFDLLEILTTDLMGMDESQQDRLLKLGRDHGVCLTAGGGMGQAYDISSDDASVRENGVRRFLSFLPTLHRMGIQKICGLLYSYWMYDYSRPVQKSQAWSRSAACMREMADAARDCDVTIMLEPVNRYENFLINTAAEAVQYVEEVGRSNVKIQLDTCHMNIEEDSMGGAIRTAGTHLGHMHICEGNRKLPGTGALPWREMARALREIGYSGDFVMEPFVLCGCEVGDTMYLFHDLSGGADDAQLAKDAADSLRFVKTLFT